MMGRHSQNQGQLFYEFCLDEAVPEDHLVRKIRALLDLSWVYEELAPYYSEIGRPSIDPVLMIRMAHLRSEGSARKHDSRHCPIFGRARSLIKTVSAFNCLIKRARLLIGPIRTRVDG